MGQFKKEQPFTHVLALDPGKKSGWALYELATERMRAGEAEFGDMCVWIERVATAYKDKLIVVCESFTITVQTAKNTSAPWSLEMIGAARSAAARHGCAWATPQAPSSAKRFSTNDQIREIGRAHV